MVGLASWAYGKTHRTHRQVVFQRVVWQNLVREQEWKRNATPPRRRSGGPGVELDRPLVAIGVGDNHRNIRGAEGVIADKIGVGEDSSSTPDFDDDRDTSSDGPTRSGAGLE